MPAKARLGMLGSVSRIGLGLWQAGGRLWGRSEEEELIGVVEEAVSRGISLFDTAEIYGWGRSERLLGEALRRAGALDSVVVASKLAGFRVTYWQMRRGLEAINRRVGRKVDLVQLHWPPPLWVPVCRVARAAERLVGEGLAGAYGLSNYPAGLVEKALECSRRFEPVSDQVQYSLAYRSPENRLLPLLRGRGMALIAWSPLAKGALAGASRPGSPAQRSDPVYREAARDRALQEALDRVSREAGLPRSVVALLWVVEKGGIPIPGTRRRRRVAEYSLALEGSLSPRHVRLLDEASARYLTRWGRCYRALQGLRLVPCGIQYVAIRLMGGV